jgi:hypothetical protein
MSCNTCSTNGRGNYNDPSVKVKGCGSSTGTCDTGGCNKLNVFDWLADMELPSGQQAFDIVEVRFKNSRKEFFRNHENLILSIGEVVAVEASPGHDIGVVSAVGEVVRLQMKKKKIKTDAEEIKKIYRKAKQQDIDKWHEAQALETQTMYKARTFALHHGLQMKNSDVEYQGDKTKAIFIGEPSGGMPNCYGEVQYFYQKYLKLGFELAMLLIFLVHLLVPFELKIFFSLQL